MDKITIGSCIYCGEKIGLEKEHVIPRALAGNFLVLEQASCRKCAEVTSSFEQRVLRGFMLDARTVGKFPTRNPKKRPESLSLQIERLGEFRQIDLPAQEHPGFLFLPLLKRAAILSGGTHMEGVALEGFESFYFGTDPVSLADELDIQAMQISENWALYSFERLLAKIAYGYAIAVHGLIPREQSFVLPLIMGTANDAPVWLGSTNFNLEIEKRNPTHAFGSLWIPDPTDDGKEILVVIVKLFSSSGATGYEIAVSSREKQIPGQER